MRSNTLTLSKSILSTWTDGVVSYLNSIRDYEVPSPEEELALFDKIKNGNEEESAAARQEIMIRHQRFVYSVAKQYAKGNDIMDLIDEGNVGMDEAIDRFDTTMGMKFTTYAVWYIRRAIVAYITNKGAMIRSTNKQKLMGALPKAKEKFIHENHREPFPYELIDILEEDYGIKIKEESDLYDLTMVSISDTMVGDDSTPSPIQTEFDTYTASRNEYEDQIDAEANSYLVERLLSVCTEKERIIMKMLYGIGYDNPVSPEDVGEALNMTPTRILQIKKNIIKKIQKAAVQLV